MVRRYKDKISGPLLDRIDLQIQVQQIPGKDLVDHHQRGESSASVLARVMAARTLQQSRQGKVNGQLNVDEVKQHCALGDSEQTFIASAIERLGLSARAYHRVLKVARTIADLQNSIGIDMPHLAEALGYRFSQGKF